MFLFALKNILFYKARTFTTFILTFVTTLLFIVFVSFMNGSHETMLENALKIYTGSIEIYKKGYRDIGGSEYLIEDVEKVESVLNKLEGIESFTPRYESFGLLSFKENSSASMVTGVNFEKEASQSELKNALVEGNYLNKNSQNCLYIGSELLKKLDAKLGSKVSYISSASDSSFVADIFKVCGVFKTGMYDFDLSSAFISKNYFDELMYSQNMASYISLRVKDLKEVDSLATSISNKLDDKTLEVLTWKELMKSMVEAMQIDSIFGYTSLSLFFVVIFFVVMIFSFINVSSRVREFGTLQAVGVKKSQVALLLFYEIVIISTIAILLATPIGAYIAHYYSINPIIIEGVSETYKDYGVVSDKIFTSFDTLTIAWNVALIYSLNLLSIIYPIIYINSFKPIEAINHV